MLSALAVCMVLYCFRNMLHKCQTMSAPNNYREEPSVFRMLAVTIYAAMHQPCTCVRRVQKITPSRIPATDWLTDRFYIPLFFASEQTHCALITSCDLQCGVTVDLHSAFLSIHRSSVLTALFWLLHGWCHVKLLQSQRTFCVHHGTMHQFRSYCYGAIRSRIRRVVCVLSCNLPPAFLAE